MRQVDAETANQLPDLARAVALRNLLVHAYAAVDETIVWGVVTAVRCRGCCRGCWRRCRRCEAAAGVHHRCRCAHGLAFRLSGIAITVPSEPVSVYGKLANRHN